MFSWATNKLEQLSQAVAPPPTDAVSRYNYCVQQGDEDGAMGCLAEIDPLTTVIQPTKGTLPIHLACEHAMVRLIRRIMAIPGADIQVVDLSGNSPLHCACLSSSSNAVNIVRMLVTEYQASVVVRNAQKMTPYEVATLNSIRQYLLPLQLQQETQQALDNGGVGLPPGIDMGGLRIKNSTLAPPPMNLGGGTGSPAGMPVNGTPAHPAPAGAGQMMFATPSPSQNVRSNSLPPEQQQQTASKPPISARAPSSGNRVLSEDSKYAMQGHSSAAVLASARFRPDGFHSSSSDVNLQRKYGHSITPPSSGGVPVPPPPPPPSSGNSGTAGAAGGSNPFAAGATALGASGRRGRYPVYTATPPGSAGSTPPYSGGYGFGAAPPINSAGPAAAATPSYAVFAPSSGGQPQLQQQQHPSGVPSAPSPTAASNPTSPYLPPPPYQGAQSQQQQPMTHQPQYPQVPDAQLQYQQQAPAQPQYQQQAPAHQQPVAMAPPAMPTRNGMGNMPTISTDSAATAEELFAQPSPLALSTAKHDKETTEEASTKPAPTAEASKSSGGAVEPLGAPSMPPANGGAMPEPQIDATTGKPTPSTTKSDNAADFFGAAAQAEDVKSKEQPQPVAGTEEPAGLETAAAEVSSATPTKETTTDVGEEPLEEVSLSPAPKETGDGSAHSTSAEPAVAQPEALFSMPPPPFSARQ